MKGFEHIRGNEEIKTYFENALESGNVSHAYLLLGEDGSGRMTLSKAFARALLCENEDRRPCGVCHSCIQFDSDNHPDVKYVTHEKPNSIGVEDVRTQLVDDIVIRPYESKYKIYIIDECEKMTVQAQNAILKTIEEPPEYGVIILLASDAEVLLQTIRSRCIQLKTRPLSDEEVVDFLKQNRKLPADTVQICASFARGNIGKAIALSESEEFAELYNTVLQLLRAGRDVRVSEQIACIKQLKSESSSAVNDMLDICDIWFRDVLMFKTTNDMNRLVFKNEYRAISERAAQSSFGGVQKIIEAIDKARVRVKANVSQDVVLELLLLTMKEN